MFKQLRRKAELLSFTHKTFEQLYKGTELAKLDLRADVRTRKPTVWAEESQEMVSLWVILILGGSVWSVGLSVGLGGSTCDKSLHPKSSRPGQIGHLLG